MRPIVTLITITAVAAAAFAGPRHDEKLYTLPERVETIHPRMAELMTWALQRPDQLTRLRAMAEVRKLKLVSLAGEVARQLTDESPLVRAAAIQTLDSLDARPHAPALLPFIAARPAWSGYDIEAALLADAALARWQLPDTHTTWAQRLADGAAPLTLRRSAAAALGQVKQGAEALHAIVLDEAAPMPLRLDAADAASRFTPPPLDTAAKLIETHPLLAAKLLAHARSTEAVPLFQTLAASTNPAVQTIAMRQLLATDPALLWPAAQTTIASVDPVVRLITVRSLPTRTEPVSVALLAPVLDDPHPDVRNEARSVLRTLAGTGALKGRILEAAAGAIEPGRAIAADQHDVHWRATEQAALLLGELDDKRAAAALVDLFDHPRLEVRLASVISLRSLAVADTRKPMAGLLDELIERLRGYSERARKMEPDQAAAEMKRGLPDSKLLDEVAQTLGAWRVMEADASLRKLIPKDFPATPDARAASVWALGLLHENKPDNALAKDLINRVFDLNPLNPEAEEVRLASVIAIGRMKAPEQVDALMNRYREDGVEIRSAARWAAMQITGKEIDPVTLEPTVRSDAFIMPIDPRPPAE